MTIISSMHNSRVKQVRALQQRKERERTGCFFAEGFLALSEALRCGAEIELLIVAPEQLAGARERALVEQLVYQGVACLEVTAEVFQSLSAKEGKHAVAAVVRQRWLSVWDIQPGVESCWVALDAVQYPGNLGTILRTCDATGAAGIILLGSSSDPYDPAAVRASTGALFSLQLARASPAEFAAWKRERRTQVAGTSPAAALDYRAATYAPPVVLLMGCERRGLPANLLALCDVVVRIPMVGRRDSLNLAVATSLMLYEVYRQRRPLDLA